MNEGMETLQRGRCLAWLRVMIWAPRLVGLVIEGGRWVPAVTPCWLPIGSP